MQLVPKDLQMFCVSQRVTKQVTTEEINEWSEVERSGGMGWAGGLLYFVIRSMYRT
jgi:hypothetical protein